MSADNSGARVVTPGQLVRGADGIYVPSRGGGSSSTLPMTDEQMRAAGEREKTIGFAPSTQPNRGECSYVLATDNTGVWS